MSIIISQKGKKSQKIEKSNFDKEDYLQNYIHENPESIPVYEIEEDKKLFVVAREFSTESGPIDALAVDKDGDIYVVETKLYKNPDKRTVVAQALDYGASLWRHSDYNQFINKIETEVENKFKIKLNDKLKSFFEIDDDQLNSLLESLKDNLHKGNIKFVILMDAIAERLKDLIVYINQNSQFDIYAVSMEYYKFDQYEIMIPKLFGLEVKKNISNKSAGSTRRKWDEQGFFEESRKILSESNIGPVIKLYNFSKKLADEIHWGTGVNRSSFSVRFNKLGNRPLFVIYSNGEMQISIEYPKRGADNKQIANLDKLNADLKVFDINLKPESQRTAILLEEWADKVEDIIRSIDKIIK